EMIETREQADALRRIGVQLGQGWYFGRPTPEPEVPWDFAPSQFTSARA
ncbi:MAG: EAL domain-containing protein, partial [Alphaproteobacteria bacterium]|nr:EAL domain-containing protein [Alphaproteobacteria bacterium]